MTQTEINTAIKTGALRKLGVLAAGATASASDDTLAGDTLGRLLDAMYADGETWFEKDIIPESAIHGLTVLLTLALANDFGLSDSRNQTVAGEAQEVRRAFRRQGRASSTDPIQFESF